MTSPTIIFHTTTTDGFITVTDVSGVHYLQQYQEVSPAFRAGNTTLIHSEQWTSGDDAIAAAKKLNDRLVRDWWEASIAAK